MEKEDFQLYDLRESDGKCHSGLKVPQSLPSHYGIEAAEATSDIYNILMADISGSMYSFWPKIVTGWQSNIKDKLTGRTEIYAFGDLIKLKRTGTELLQEDFTVDCTNDLTGALRTVRLQVEKCKESNVRVFIIADGAHDHGDPLPESEICQMRSPPGKTVSVFVLGLGQCFPVQNSIDIRSQMHSGNANIPFLFWAKNVDDIVDQIVAIGEELNSSQVKLKLNIEGSILPGLEGTSVIHLGEWIYFDQAPEILPPLTLSINDGDPVALTVKTMPSNLQLLLDSVFRQWNSVLIQQHRKKAHVPHETFGLMESMFSVFWDILTKDKPEGKAIISRLAQKKLKAYDLEFKTLMNQSKMLINLEKKFSDQLDLANTILKSTVTNKKYDAKNLKWKGHDHDDYKEDMKSFLELYEKAKERIMALPPPSPDDCCRVTITSTLSDLQDPDFTLICAENKFDFLKTFTMTGIPVYAPVRDSSQINPWALVIKHMLVNPFTILGQLVLEESAAVNSESLGEEDKDVILQRDNEKTRFNAIIPIIPAVAAEVLKPLVCSKIYAMMTTFCILKNPHIIDYNAHVAALGCAWVRSVGEYPQDGRPEFVCVRIENIVATARLYMERPSVQHYVCALVTHPKLALMTESTEEVDGKILNCQSLVKPTFFAHLIKDKLSPPQILNLYKHVLLEFVGRCLSSCERYDEEATPFTSFFCQTLADPKEKDVWLQNHCKTIVEAFKATQGNLLRKFFTLDDLLSCLKKYVDTKMKSTKATLIDDMRIGIDMKKVEVYVSEALRFKNSKERLSREMPQADSIRDLIQEKLVQENMRTLRRAIMKEVEKWAVEEWRKSYLKVHMKLVMPLTQLVIVEEAQSRDIQVTHETFSQVYRYNDRLGLLRNACQVTECPHYLQPHNNFNQHLSIEREQEHFPHSLHLVSHECCQQGTIQDVVEKVISGKHAGTRDRKNPTPPDPNALEYLTAQMETLLEAYADNFSQSSTKRCPPSLLDEDDEEEFYDCSS